MMVEHLAFIDTRQSMDIAESDRPGEHMPLSITITGPSAGHIQSYNMNENELFALFNLLYKILKRDYTKKIKELWSIEDQALDRMTRDKAREIEERQFEEGALDEVAHQRDVEERGS